MAGGGARRGPFLNKRETFATRLTTSTMGGLHRLADQNCMSLSQMAELLLCQAIRAHDRIETEVEPRVAAYRETLILRLIEEEIP